MSRRARALGFLAAAIACATLAALAASGYRDRVSSQFGELRPVVVAVTELPGGAVLDPTSIRAALETRRVPVRFAPADALRRPVEAIGRAPAATVPAGSYLLASQLIVPGPKRAPRPKLGRGHHPVQISVSGAGALLVGGGSPEGRRVDVIVSEQADLGRRGRAYVAASGVPLLALDGPGGPGSDGTWRATLALDRRQALELIAAEGFARQIRLLPRG